MSNLTDEQRRTLEALRAKKAATKAAWEALGVEEAALYESFSQGSGSKGIATSHKDKSDQFIH